MLEATIQIVASGFYIEAIIQGDTSFNRPHLVHSHGYTLWQVSLDVLQEDVSSGTCDLLHLHQSHVCADLVLDSVLLEDVHGLQHSELLYTSGQGQPGGQRTRMHGCTIATISTPSPNVDVQSLSSSDNEAAIAIQDLVISTLYLGMQDKIKKGKF